MSSWTTNQPPTCVNVAYTVSTSTKFLYSPDWRAGIAGMKTFRVIRRPYTWMEAAKTFRRIRVGVRLEIRRLSIGVRDQ